MSQDPLFEHLREQAWRRKLSPAEEAQLSEWLAAHPEAREDWEVEAGLSEGLGRLQDYAVPSNFTARVLQAVELDRAAAERAKRRHVWFGHRWLRWAVYSIILTAGLVTYQSYVQRARTEQLAKSLAAVSRVAPLPPSLEILTNFDVICALDRTPPPDEDLLKLLQ
jgi:hypothetical protein